MAQGQNGRQEKNSAGVQDITFDTFKKAPGIRQGAVNSVRPQKPGSKKPTCSMHDPEYC